MSKIKILRSDNDYMKLAQFVINENYSHHRKINQFSESKTEALYNEEVLYRNHSTVYALQDDNCNFVGTIRVLKWNYRDILPIEKIFSINPLHILEDGFQSDVWHIGRFAIRKNEGLLPLKKLMTLAIGKVCENNGNIAFAECDTKLLNILFLMGIEPKIIGKSKYYLGSETIPVLLTYENLLRFYNKNEHLVIGYKEHLSPHNQTNNLIFKYINTNYSFV